MKRRPAKKPRAWVELKTIPLKKAVALLIEDLRRVQDPPEEERKARELLPIAADRIREVMASKSPREKRQAADSAIALNKFFVERERNRLLALGETLNVAAELEIAALQAKVDAGAEGVTTADNLAAVMAAEEEEAEARS